MISGVYLSHLLGFGSHDSFTVSADVKTNQVILTGWLWYFLRSIFLVFCKFQ